MEKILLGCDEGIANAKNQIETQADFDNALQRVKAKMEKLMDEIVAFSVDELGLPLRMNLNYCVANPVVKEEEDGIAQQLAHGVCGNTGGSLEAVAFNIYHLKEVLESKLDAAQCGSIEASLKAAKEIAGVQNVDKIIALLGLIKIADRINNIESPEALMDILRDAARGA